MRDGGSRRRRHRFDPIAGRASARSGAAGVVVIAIVLMGIAVLGVAMFLSGV